MKTLTFLLLAIAIPISAFAQQPQGQTFRGRGASVELGGYTIPPGHEGGRLTLKLSWTADACKQPRTPDKIHARIEVYLVKKTGKGRKIIRLGQKKAANLRDQLVVQFPYRPAEHGNIRRVCFRVRDLNVQDRVCRGRGLRPLIESTKWRLIAEWRGQ